MNIRTRHTNNPLTFGLALAAGIGIILMIIALALGAVRGEAADSTAFNLTLIGGILLTILGIGGWLAVVQPFKHFDDINVPQDTGHHGHELAVHNAGEVNVHEPDAQQHEVTVATTEHH